MTVATTRRGLLGSLAAAPLLARAASAAAPPAPAARPPVVRRGRAVAVSRDGRLVAVAHDRRRSVALVGGGRTQVVDLPGQPVAVAVSPRGTLVAVGTGFWDRPGLTLLAAGSGKLLRSAAVGPAPADVVFAAGRLLAAGGEQEGTLHVLDPWTLRTLIRAEVGRVPRAIAAGSDGAWVSLNADERVVLVDLHNGRIRRELRTPGLPDRIALSPDGKRLLVTHGHSTQVTELDVRSGRVRRHDAGRHPSGVGWTTSGRRLVALGGEAAVQCLGGRRLAVDPAPRGLAVAGRRFWTVSALTGAVSRGRA